MLKNILLALPLFGALFAAPSCKTRVSSAPAQIGTVEVLAADSGCSSPASAPQLWHASEKRLCILFGYGYNDSDFVDGTLARLGGRYGTDGDGGLLYPLVFPDDFKRGSRSFVSELKKMLSARDLCGLIILGAPENTHAAVSDLQEEWGGSLPYPVFSFFPQDDVLGTEYTSDFILDKAQTIEAGGMILNETEHQFVEDVPQILENAVRYMLMLDGPLEKNAALFDFVKSVAAPLSVSRYADPDTGLFPVNHFVLE